MKVTLNPLSSTQAPKAADPLKALQEKVMKVWKETQNPLPLRFLAEPQKHVKAMEAFVAPSKSPSPAQRASMSVAKFVFFDKKPKPPTPPPMPPVAVEPKVVTPAVNLLKEITAGKTLKAVEQKKVAVEPKKDDFATLFAALMVKRRETMGLDDE